jgi:hypothetical protein
LLEAVQADHHWPEFFGLQRHQWPHVLVPGRQEGQDRDVAIAGPDSGMTILR